MSIFIDLACSRSGPDVAEYLMDQTGTWTISMLVASLAMSPLRQITGNNFFLTQRRQIGLFTFFYGTIHAASFTLFYLDLGLSTLTNEISTKPYIIFGLLCWLCLLPLALTSTNYFQRLMGSFWVRLHKLIYFASILACIHIWLQARSDFTKEIVVSAIITALLIWRIWRKRYRRQSVGLIK